MDLQHIRDAIDQACQSFRHKRLQAPHPETKKMYDREIRKWRRLLNVQTGGVNGEYEHMDGLFHAQKQKQTYAMTVEQVVELTSPYIMYAKTSSPSWLANKYIYWYAYSLGKVRNIMYGIATSRDPENGWTFKIKFACSFNSLITLNQVMDHLKAKGYTYVAALTKDNITPTIAKYTGDKVEYDVNRSDVPADKSHYAGFAKSFKEYLEHLRYAATPVSGACIRYEQFLDMCKDNCRKNKQCRQFSWGEHGCRVKADLGSPTDQTVALQQKTPLRSRHASRSFESDDDEDIL